MARPTMLKLALVIALTMAASVAYATPTKYTGANNDIGGSSFSASNKVNVFAATDGTSGSFDGQNYSIRAYHDAGDKVIAGKSGDSRIYFATTTPGQGSAHSGAATTDDYASSSGTWSSM